MMINDILAKLKKGEVLSAEEKAAFDAFDLQAAMDAVATGGRKKAEADAVKAAKDAADAQAKLKELQDTLTEGEGKGKTELQRLQDQIAALSKTVATEQAEKAKLVRQQKLSDVIRESGIQFVQEVDGRIMRQALESEFAQLADDDLADVEKIKPVISTFRARNKAVIADTSGFGTGQRKSEPSPVDRLKDVEKMTADERAADLKKKGIL